MHSVRSIAVVRQVCTFRHVTKPNSDVPEEDAACDGFDAPGDNPVALRPSESKSSWGVAIG
jgi:hypothetical protein